MACRPRQAQSNQLPPIRPQGGRNNRSTELQSNTTPIVPTESEQLTEFSQVEKVDVPGLELAPTMKNYDATISDFLARPRYIGRFIWATSDVSGNNLAQVAILNTLLAKPEVINKVNGYAQIRCRLHVRVNINGSMYHGGRVLLNWGQSGGDSVNSIGYSPRSSIQLVTISQKSTLPHCWINPCAEKAYELSIPFVHSQGYYDLSFGASAYDMMRLTVVNPLAWYGGVGVAPSVSLTVYAWMTDVELCTPIVQQSELSGAMSNVVASFPRKIRGFASTFARAAVDVALTSAGLGNPADLPPVAPVRAAYLPRTKADGPTYCESIAAHRLVENPITPLTPEDDPMSFRTIASKEAHFSRISWTDNASPTGLAYFPVTPMMVVSSTVSVAGTADLFTQLLPMGFVAFPFRYWRGTVRFRVEVVAPKLVRGMLRLRYLPRDYLVPSFTTESGDVLTKYIDVSESCEIDMDIPFCAPSPWLQVDLSYNSTTINGTFCIDIVEPLKSNGIGVEVNVFASCPDLEVSTQEPSSYFFTRSLGSTTMIIPQAVVMDPSTNIRDIIKLPKKWRLYNSTGSPTAVAETFTFRAEPDYPVLGGVSEGAIITFLTPLAWYSSGFIASRGSVRYHVTGTAPASDLVLKSAELIAQEASGGVATLTMSNYQTQLEIGAHGLQVMKEVTGESAFSFEVPVLVPCDFRLARFDNSNVAVSKNASYVRVVFDTRASEVDDTLPTALVLISAGDDYSLDHFQFVPLFS